MGRTGERWWQPYHTLRGREEERGQEDRLAGGRQARQHRADRPRDGSTRSEPVSVPRLGSQRAGNQRPRGVERASHCQESLQ